MSNLIPKYKQITVVVERVVIWFPVEIEDSLTIILNVSLFILMIDIVYLQHT